MVHVQVRKKEVPDRLDLGQGEPGHASLPRVEQQPLDRLAAVDADKQRIVAAWGALDQAGDGHERKRSLSDTEVRLPLISPVLTIAGYRLSRPVASADPWTARPPQTVGKTAYAAAAPSTATSARAARSSVTLLKPN